MHGVSSSTFDTVQDLESYQPGWRAMKVTLKTIADDVGTSVATVSLALADHPRIGTQTKTRIREASKRLGYSSPSDLAARRRRAAPHGGDAMALVKFLVVGLTVRQQAANSMLSALLGYPAKLGMRIEIDALDIADQQNEQAWTLRHAATADGLILYGGVTADLVRELTKLDVPAVGIGPLRGERLDAGESVRFRSIGFDEVAAGRQATEALLAAGHRRIALVSAKGTPGLYYDRWEDGYRLALSRAGLALDPALLDRTGGTAAADPETHPFFSLTDGPTAWIAPDPTHYMLLQAAYQTMGRPLPASACVLGGSLDSLRDARLEDFPALAVDPSQLMRVALEQVRDLLRASAGSHSITQLPHHVRHFDRLTTQADAGHVPV